MAGESDKEPISNRQQIIKWYKSDVERYRGMIGEETEYGTIVTEKLIKNTETRIKELEEKEKRLDGIRRRLYSKC